MTPQLHLELVQRVSGLGLPVADDDVRLEREEPLENDRVVVDERDADPGLALACLGASRVDTPDRVICTSSSLGRDNCWECNAKFSANTGRPTMTDGVQSKAREAAGTTAEKGQDVADRAKSEASQVTDTAKDQARQVKDEVTTQARGLVDQAKTELRDQGRSQADHAAQAIHRVADQATALADGRTDEAGAVAGYVRRAGEQVGHIADRLDQRGVEGVLNDVQNFARRRPGAFLLGCAAAGFAAGRLIRGGAASSGSAEPEGNGDRSTQPSSMYAPPTA